MEPELIDAIEKACAEQSDKPYQSEMIRRLIREGLTRMGLIDP